MSERDTGRLSDKEIAFLAGSGITLVFGSVWYLVGFAKAAGMLGILLFFRRAGVRMTRDRVNHPRHYQANGIESIDVIEAFGLGFHLGNVVKYVLRSDRKGKRTEDLKKAAWYLQREIERSAKR
jgi:hypothetical protein